MLKSNAKKLMADKNMSTRALAVLTGLADKTILRARSGQIVECRLYTLQTIAKYLECGVKDCS